MTGTTMNAKVNMSAYAGDNFAKLPKKADCTPEMWQAMNCLDAAWKSFVKSTQTDTPTVYTEKAKKALADYMSLTGLPTRYESALTAMLKVAYSPKQDCFKSASMLTYKKTVLRATVRMQSGTFALTNEVKERKSKAGKTEEVISFNITTMSAEEVAERMHITVELAAQFIAQAVAAQSTKAESAKVEAC